ncbi:MAG TPA: hypothetical protein VGX75_06905 [bacterium]|nr:hypothetical protein [bacterium]
MRRRRQVRTTRRPGRSAAAAPRARSGRRAQQRAPRSPAGSLPEVLKFQAKSTAALRAVKLAMAVEPSFIYKP